MKEWEPFPVIDSHISVGDAAEAIARRKARGAVVRWRDAFELVGWKDVAEALERSESEPLQTVKSIPIPDPEIRVGEIAHVDVGRLRDLKPGLFQEAQLFTCSACGYRGERPRPDCPKESDCPQAPV